MNEFDIIKKYFSIQPNRPEVRCGIGDDAAIVTVPEHKELVMTTDTLVADVHFPIATSADAIGYKSLAVNLSDLAAMGATPLWVTLALTLPENNFAWLEKFAQGFFALAQQYQVQLIGGDITKGPLSITVQALGTLPKGKALLRSMAKPNDLIYVSGTLGNAGLALKMLKENGSLSTANQEFLLQHLNYPQPRINLGQALLAYAHAAIDISDGLAADLDHILKQSHVGASINVDQLPLSSVLTQTLPKDKAIALALTAGDDYELCFTIPKNAQDQLKLLSDKITCIGEITENPGLTLYYQDGSHYHGTLSGYQHF